MSILFAGGNMKKVSVIVPCYNVERYIDVCLQSIMSQTISKNDYEVILINDCSSDNTYKHLQKWEADYSDIITVVNLEQNCGVSNSRNIGLEIATGEYVTFIDSDDWVESNYLERLLEIAYDEYCDVVLGAYNRTEKCEYIQGLASKGKVYKYHFKDISVRKSFIIEYVWRSSVWGALYKREFILRENLSFPDGLLYEDGFFLYMVYFTADSIAVCEDILYHYYKNQSGIIQGSCEAKQRERMVILYMFYDIAVQKGLPELYYDELELLYIRKYYTEMLEIMFRRFKNVNYAVFCEIKSRLKQWFPNYINNKYIEDLDRLFLRCSEYDFDESKLNEFRTVCLKKIYGIEKLKTSCSNELRDVPYPQLEEFEWGLEQLLAGSEDIEFEEYIQLFKCVPILENPNERIELLLDEDLFTRGAVYRYIVDRECMIEYLKDKIKREDKNMELYGRIIEAVI